MFDKLKDMLPGIGTVIGFLGFGKVQGIIVGVVSTLVFLAGVNIGHNIGFKAGYYEGKKACEREQEPGGRRIWPWRGGEIDMTPVEPSISTEAV